MTISNYDDIIDSRDVIARIEKLESEQAELVEMLNNGDITESEMQAFDKEGGAELDALRELAEEAEQYAPDWNYGATLIRDSYFTYYVMELLADIGDLPRDIPSYIVIDEEATAENIKMDYTAVDFEGITYWIR